jgi:hypothetical protein
MLSRRLRPYAWLMLVASLLAIVYALMAVAAIASLSGAPNYHGNARHDAGTWELFLLVPIILTIACITVLIRTRRRVSGG